jgi:hypothetical protein
MDHKVIASWLVSSQDNFTTAPIAFPLKNIIVCGKNQKTLQFLHLDSPESSMTEIKPVKEISFTDFNAITGLCKFTESTGIVCLDNSNIKKFIIDESGEVSVQSFELESIGKCLFCTAVNGNICIITERGAKLMTEDLSIIEEVEFDVQENAVFASNTSSLVILQGETLKILSFGERIAIKETSVFGSTLTVAFLSDNTVGRLYSNDGYLWFSAYNTSFGVTVSTMNLETKADVASAYSLFFTNDRLVYSDSKGIYSLSCRCVFTKLSQVIGIRANQDTSISVKGLTLPEENESNKDIIDAMKKMNMEKQTVSERINAVLDDEEFESKVLRIVSKSKDESTLAKRMSYLPRNVLIVLLKKGLTKDTLPLKLMRCVMSTGLISFDDVPNLIEEIMKRKDYDLLRITLKNVKGLTELNTCQLLDSLIAEDKSTLDVLLSRPIFDKVLMTSSLSLMKSEKVLQLFDYLIEKFRLYRDYALLPIQKNSIRFSQILDWLSVILDNQAINFVVNYSMHTESLQNILELVRDEMIHMETIQKIKACLMSIESQKEQKTSYSVQVPLYSIEYISL